MKWMNFQAIFIGSPSCKKLSQYTRDDGHFLFVLVRDGIGSDEKFLADNFIASSKRFLRRSEMRVSVPNMNL